MLVDPELARLARELLHEPGETNGKGNMSTLLGTHEISSGIGLGLEPPLSPPVVHGPSAMTTAGPSAHMDLPSPPPALRPPESSMAPGPAPTPEPAPAPPAAPEIPVQQVQPAQAPAPPPPPPPAPVQQQTEPLIAPEPLAPVAPQADPAPVELKPVTPASEPEVEIAAVAPPPPEPELPAMAPEPEAPALEQAEAPAPPAEPVAEPAVPEIQVIAAPAPVAAPAPIEAPAPPVEEARIELPTVGSVEPSAPELPAAPEPVAEPVFELPAVAAQPGAFRVVVRLTDGDGVEVGEFRDFGTAMQGAQEVIDEFSHSNGSWPFYAGRFIRPDLIVSVDVVDASAS
jgi:hypothetical protein